jgi:hypothetical protein
MLAPVEPDNPPAAGLLGQIGDGLEQTGLADPA